MSSRMRVEWATGGRGCGFAWCVTEHGSTVHPDDEDHRSAGVGMTVRVRDDVTRGPGVSTKVEVGLLRRIDESETWLVVEAGAGSSLSIPLHSARALVASVRDDSRVGGLLVPDID